ncbi:hypothetical protein [Actinospica robiniae]|uniref:hypothetical protein n=1 Tax=Actinospica robiniae TaxID=304901 RepID=UPI00040A831E|nr:hypothetical protein [Actinospica robiniae]
MIQFINAQAEQVRGLDVGDEIADALARLDPGARVAVFGCGPRVPDGGSERLLADFDEQVVGQLRSRHPRDRVRHNLGIRLDVPNQAVDAVIVTSRLRGLWERFGADVLAEAARIGARTLITFDDSAVTPAAPSHTPLPRD